MLICNYILALVKISGQTQVEFIAFSFDSSLSLISTHWKLNFKIIRVHWHKTFCQEYDQLETAKETKFSFLFNIFLNIRNH